MREVRQTTGAARQTIAGALRGSGSTAVAVIVAAAVGLGVPVFWVWVASQIAGTERDVTPSLALFITVSILISYWVVLLVGFWIRGHLVSEDEDMTKIRRASWNRSFRDEAYRAGDHRSDPVELVFVITAVVAVIAFEVWFFFFAGSPLPNQSLF